MRTTTTREAIAGVDEIPRPRTIGEKIAAEYDLGYAGLGNRTIADLIDKGVKRAKREDRRRDA